MRLEILAVILQHIQCPFEHVMRKEEKKILEPFFYEISTQIKKRKASIGNGECHENRDREHHQQRIWNDI